MKLQYRIMLVSSAACIALTPVAAVAQQTEAEPEQDIVVTGSRVLSIDDSSISVTSVDSQQLSGFGRTSIGDQLSELPALRETETQQNAGVFGGGGVTGANLLDLRGLGTTRTLVLENGRRHVASQPGSAAVDINLMPLDLINRVDVVTGGASAVYGSDAVSGVVNFILDDRFEGLRGRAQAGISSRGDAANRLAAITYGQQFAGGRGRFVASIDYEAREPLFNADRDFARFGSGYFTNPADPGDGASRENGVPDQILFRDTRIIDSSTGGTVVNPAFDFVTIQPNSILRFAPDGTLNPANLGRGPIGSGFFTEGGDGTNIRESLDLLPLLRRYGAFCVG